MCMHLRRACNLWCACIFDVHASLMCMHLWRACIRLSCVIIFHVLSSYHHPYASIFLCTCTYIIIFHVHASDYNVQSISFVHSLLHVHASDNHVRSLSSPHSLIRTYRWTYKEHTQDEFDLTRTMRVIYVVYDFTRIMSAVYDLTRTISVVYDLYDLTRTISVTWRAQSVSHHSGLTWPVQNFERQQE